MSNKLRQVTAQLHRLSSAEAEVWLLVEAERVTPTTEVRGRLMGPRCPGASTIEVAYPLRPFSQQPEGASPLSRRVVIPEPSLWETEQPYVYRAVVELWEDGRQCDRAEFDYGLRMAGAEPRATSPDTGRSS
jgi:beta-galactosidase/beta-glucuronidase